MLLFGVGDVYKDINAVSIKTGIITGIFKAWHYKEGRKSFIVRFLISTIFLTKTIYLALKNL